jgi:predicted lactoylglutathione lyase
MDQLSPEQRQAVLMQAQQEANQRIMQDVRYYLSVNQKGASARRSCMFFSLQVVVLLISHQLLQRMVKTCFNKCAGTSVRNVMLCLSASDFLMRW